MKFPGLQNTFKQQNLFYNCIKSLNLVFVQLDLFQSQSNQSEYGAPWGGATLFLFPRSLCSVLIHRISVFATRGRLSLH